MSFLVTAAIGSTAASIYASDKASDKAGDASKNAAAAQSQRIEEGLEESESRFNVSLNDARKQFNRSMETLAPFIEGGEQAFAEQMLMLGIAPKVEQQYHTIPREYEPIGVSGNPITGSLKRTMSAMGRGGIFNEKIPYTQEEMAQLQEEANEAARLGQENIYRGIMESPEYQSLVSEGEEAILANASATGGLRGGDTQEFLSQYRPQVLSDLVNQRFERLGGISQLGQSSAVSSSNIGANYGSNILNSGTNRAAQIAMLYGDLGATEAGGIIGEGQADASKWSAISDIANVGIGSALGKLF